MGHLDYLRTTETSHQHSPPWMPCQTHVALTSAVHATSGAICGPAVRSDQHRGWCEPGKETAVQQERQRALLTVCLLHRLHSSNAPRGLPTSHRWAQVMTLTPELPSPSESGWNKKPGGGWCITWTTIPEVSEACR